MAKACPARPGEDPGARRPDPPRPGDPACRPGRSGCPGNSRPPLRDRGRRVVPGHSERADRQREHVLQRMSAAQHRAMVRDTGHPLTQATARVPPALHMQASSRCPFSGVEWMGDGGLRRQGYLPPGRTRSYQERPCRRRRSSYHRRRLFTLMHEAARLASATRVRWPATPGRDAREYVARHGLRYRVHQHSHLLELLNVR
jgi:hypothetical protein